MNHSRWFSGVAVGLVVLLVVVGTVYVVGVAEESGEEGVPVDASPAPAFEPPTPETNPGTLDAEHGEFAGFSEVSETVGLTYETEYLTQRLIGSHGVSVVDFNNNGYEDVLLTGGETPVLFENTKDGRYEKYRAFDHPDAMTAHFLDYNNNGYRDLVVVSLDSPPTLYENVEGEFVQRDAGFDRTIDFPVTVTSADVTGNGCLDVYVGSWAVGSMALSPDEALAVGQQHPDVRPTTTDGASNHLFAGDCNSFEDVTESAGVGGTEFTLATSAADFTGNGHVDIHAGNDWTTDYLYENQGDGTFERIDLGSASDRNAMSSAVMDLTGNHKLDIFVTNVYVAGEYDIEDLIPVMRIPLPEGNNLFANEGGGEFRDIAPEHGLDQGAWGWAATVADYTNDGHLDIIHASSYTSPAVVEEQPDVFRPPQVWKGTGESWEKVDGLDMGFQEHNIRGLARIDYQNDGTLDLVTVGNPSQTTVPGARPGANRSFLYENKLTSNESLQLWVRNSEGLERNAEVYIETDERTLYREANARSDLLSQDSRLIHVGTANEAVERVVVVWPDGTATEYDSLTAGNRYILTPESVGLVE